MKIKFNEKALRIKMAENNVRSYVELCKKSGIVYTAFQSAKRRNNLSREMYWLIADFLGCHIEELQFSDWED